MAILYLQWSTQAFGPRTTFDTTIRDEVVREIEAMANRAHWPAQGNRRVELLPDTTLGRVSSRPPNLTTHDCIVYLVYNYNNGPTHDYIARERLTIAADSPNGVLIANAQNFSYVSELGLTWPGDISISEVHVGKCMRFLSPIEQSATLFSSLVPARRGELIRTLAITAVHEAMHNKVEPEMPAGWEQHDHCHGVGGPIGCTQYGIASCRINLDSVGTPPAPRVFDDNDRSLLHDHFASQHEQYVWT